MRDCLCLGPTPCDEPCQQLGPDYDPQQAREECRRYRDQLVRRFPLPNGVLASFAVKSFPHDFGNYLEVCVVYDDDDEEAAEYAFFVENNLPENWDEPEVLVFEPQRWPEPLKDSLHPEGF